MLAWGLLVVAAPFAWVAATSVVLLVVQPPITALQAIRLVEGRGLDRDVVPLAEMTAALPRAVIAAEDNFFCAHPGVDWTAFHNEWRRWHDGERPRGASTITMQLTRNLYLWPDRDPFRKALELALAPVVDLILPKERQLALYLNQVEFGPGIYGAEAAARYWFDKRAANLSADEAASLAALLPGPLIFRPGDGRVRAQAARIRTRQGQLGPLLDCAPGT